MRPKERFLAALKRQPVDRVPQFDFLFQKPLFSQLLGRTPEGYNARDALDLTLALGFDAVWTSYGCPSGWAPARLSKDTYIDEWGTTFQTGEAAWPIDAPIAFPIRDSNDLASYRPPDPTAPGRMDELNRAVLLNANLGEGAVAVLGGVGGPFTMSWMLLGYEAICMNVYEDPGFLRDVAQLTVDFTIRIIGQIAEVGVDGLFISEDLGSSHGGLLPPETFRSIYLPALATIVQAIQSTGLPVLLHSCGCIYDYLDDLVKLGLDALHPLQRTAWMDLEQVKRQYGDRLCLIGNIDSSRTLPFGNAADVASEVQQAIEIAAPGWGYVLASDHSLHDGIPVDNILAMGEAGRRYGVYGADGKPIR